MSWQGGEPERKLGQNDNDQRNEKSPEDHKMGRARTADLENLPVIQEIPEKPGPVPGAVFIAAFSPNRPPARKAPEHNQKGKEDEDHVKGCQQEFISPAFPIFSISSRPETGICPTEASL